METGKYLMGHHEIQGIEIWVYHKSDIDFLRLTKMSSHSMPANPLTESQIFRN